MKKLLSAVLAVAMLLSVSLTFVACGAPGAGLTVDAVKEDAAKNVSANAAEEAILGMLLMYDEHREAVKKKKIELDADDFFTALGKRIFEKAMELHSSDEGFSLEMMEEAFSADEMGRIQKLIKMREALADNGTKVLASNAVALKESKTKAEGGGLEAILKAKREKLAKNQNPT